MALIKCTECGKDISDKAIACPNCGNPLATVQKDESLVTIQATKKKWKFVKLLSWIVFIFGLIMLFSNSVSGTFNDPKLGVGLTLAFFGFIGIIVGKFGAWWSNG